MLMCSNPSECCCVLSLMAQRKSACAPWRMWSRLPSGTGTVLAANTSILHVLLDAFGLGWNRGVDHQRSTRAHAHLCAGFRHNLI